MKKLYQIVVTFDTGRKVIGPVVTENDREDFVELIDQYNDLTVFRLTDGFRRVVIPQQMLERGYVELRRVSLLRVILQTVFRRLFL